MTDSNGIQGRNKNTLKRDLQIIWEDGGIDTELYRAVAGWREMVQSNNGRYIKGDFKDRDWPQMVESLMPLLLGVEGAEEKAIKYFREQTPSEEIGDKKFSQRARLWETLGMYMDQGGIIIDNKPTLDVAGIVLSVLPELNPEIQVELDETQMDRR